MKTYTINAQYKDYEIDPSDVITIEANDFYEAIKKAEKELAMDWHIVAVF